jgi:predicted dehydrogenase
MLRKMPNVRLAGVCAQTGVTAAAVRKRFQFLYATTDEGEIINDPAIDAVVIATRHHLHARQVLAALKAGKHVFVEKPLCLTREELHEIEKTYSTLSATANPRAPVLQVGYNRRFAPMAQELKAFFQDVQEPLLIHYRVNAGYLPPDHWVHDPQQGGGRILGEVCHFVDFLIFLTGSLPTQVYARALPNNGRYRDDNVAATLEFADQSLGIITYVANGDTALPKERVEVFGGGQAAVLDNFRRLELIKAGRRRVKRSWLQQDRGFRGEWEAFVRAFHKPEPSLPIPIREVFGSTMATFQMIDPLFSNNKC